jgi:hypothetical protein
VILQRFMQGNCSFANRCHFASSLTYQEIGYFLVSGRIIQEGGTYPFCF